MMTDRTFRTRVLNTLGASPAAIQELLSYNENPFKQQEKVPADDEPFVTTWESYAYEAQEKGVFQTLREHLIQLQFPIQAGLSQTAPYRQAVKRGIWPKLSDSDGLYLQQPDCLRLILYSTAAGRLPLLITDYRPDFILLLQALTCRNEPVPAPDSMGAMMVSGYNNWDRIRSYRNTWQQHTLDRSDAAWSTTFQQIVAKRYLYQDCFILLSNGPYSAIPAHDLGLKEDTWHSYSLMIRREHECAHYYTRRILGAMRNNMLDEIIADFMGITAAIGRYRADWFLRFVGLENYPAYRRGGRLENYRGNPPLSEEAFQLLQALVYHAALHLEQSNLTFSPEDAMEKAMVIQTMTRLTLEEMASQDALTLIRESNNTSFWMKPEASSDNAAYYPISK